MGHYMSTLADNEVDPETLPGTGEIVNYITRPGEGRRGKRKFPAIVLGRSSTRGPTGLDLLVFFDALDFVSFDSCQQFSEQQDSACWEVRPGADLIGEITTLRAENASLRAAVLGEWAAPEGGMMEYLVDFEKRLKAIEAKTEKAKAK